MPSLAHFSLFFLLHRCFLYPAAVLFQFGTVARFVGSFFQPPQNPEICRIIIFICHPKVLIFVSLFNILMLTKTKEANPKKGI